MSHVYRLEIYSENAGYPISIIRHVDACELPIPAAAKMVARFKGITRNIGARTKVMGRRNFQESIIVSINKTCL